MARRRAFWIAAAVAAAAVAIVMLSRSGGRPSKGSRLRVLFSGETQGELEPCNCSEKMAGGLPARAGYIARQKGDFLLLDTGCVGKGAREFEVLRAEAALRGMKTMGYDAVNVGEHELWLGREGLARLAAVGVPFVSANALDGDGRPAAAPYLLFERAGLTVAVTGLVDDSDAAGPGLRAADPRETLARILPELREKAGVIIVLADLDIETVRALARDFPEVACILFRGRGDSHAPELVNRTVIASVYGDARYLGDMTLTWEDGRRVSGTGEAVLLDERFAPSLKVISASIEWYKSAVRERTFDLSDARPGWDRIRPSQAEADNRFVGSETCAKCHPYQYETWKKQRHSRAMESLKKGGYDWSPECVVCHVVGYGSPDGYRSMKETPELGRVGCEDCHGRGYVLRNGSCKGLARRGAEQTCRQCHTMQKHAAFDFAKQWAIINHKEKKK